MMLQWDRARLGRTGWSVLRLGFSASYRPGKKTVFRAFDEGVNFFFGFGMDTQLTGAMRDLFPAHRDRVILATGAYNFIWGHPGIRRTLEKRLRQFGTDRIDLFMFLGVMKPGEFPESLVAEFVKLRQEGKVGAIGLSTHHRKFAGELARKGDLDVLMVRYNAAHPGAEADIFPHLELHDTGCVAYTATRWRAMMRRPKGWAGPVPTAPEAYRWVLANPRVDVCLTAPRSEKELLENLQGLRQGPLPADRMDSLRAVGEAVHRQQKWFM
jgi:aryl-alcohol dehydrogenase-like predicted oxidoreductase